MYSVKVSCDDKTDNDRDDVSLSRCVSEFLWPVYLGIELLGHRIYVKSTFISKMFSRAFSLQDMFYLSIYLDLL